MTEFADRYTEIEDANEKYRLLRQEAKALRRGAPSNFRGNEQIHDLLTERNQEFEGTLLAFCANDFGLPLAYRPEGVSIEIQNRVREAILANKYASDSELNKVRERVLEAEPRIHKALLAVVGDDDVRYHAPGGRSEDTLFLTVRELVGLVDYVTNSGQREGLSETYS